MFNRRLAPGLQALLLPAALIAMTGCSTTDPFKSSENHLTELSVGRLNLAPAFSPDATAFSLDIYSDTPSLTFTAKVKDTTAKVTFNGSDNPVVALKNGTQAIEVAVTAENGDRRVYTVNVNKHTPNVMGTIQESCNGVPLPKATLVLKDSAGAVLESGIPVGTDGSVRLGLDPAKTYSLVADAPERAQSSVESFNPGKDSSFALYCLPAGMKPFPVVAPVITKMEYSADGSTWNLIQGNAATVKMADLKQIRVTANGRTTIQYDDWSGFGIRVNLDQTAWTMSQIQPLKTDVLNAPKTINGQTWYESTTTFPVTLTNLSAGGQHFVDVVVYDQANNRTEQKVYLTVTDATDATADPDLSAVVPVLRSRFETYGSGQDYYSDHPDTIGTYDGNSTSYRNYHVLIAGSTTTPPGIRGFEVYRSTDQQQWTKVYTRLYPTLNKGGAAPATYIEMPDPDASMDANTTYYFKARAFSGNTTANGGFSQWSKVINGKFLPPFLVKLAAPANASITHSLTPSLSFSINNASLMSASVSDYYYFTLYLQDKAASSSVTVPLRYNFAKAIFETKVGTTWGAADVVKPVLSDDKTTVTLTLPSGILMPGVTYEWTIYGTKGSNSASTSDQAQFTRTYWLDATDTQNYVWATSYGSDFKYSYGASNGRFTLIVAADAQ